MQKFLIVKTLMESNFATESEVSAYRANTARPHPGLMLSKHMEKHCGRASQCEGSASGMLHQAGSFPSSSAEIHACHMVLFPRITSKGSGIKDLVLY